MPSRPYFSDKIVPDLYQETRESVIHELKQAQYVSVTTDGWTSRATESYITITAHYLVDGQLRSKVLQTRQLLDAHNAENIADVMKSVMDEWKIAKPSITIPITTDNAQNVVKSVQIVGFWPHIICFAHCLNLATQKGLDIHVVSRLLGRVKRIVTFFHASSTATKVLSDKQCALDLPKHKLVQDVKTRWNSSYDMLERYLEQQPTIFAARMSKQISRMLLHCQIMMSPKQKN
jgi:hypothetical protein